MFQTVSGEAYAPVADFQVSADTLEYQSAPAYAKLGDGGFVAIWFDSRFGNWSMRMQRFDLNGSKMGAEIVLPAGSGASLAPTPTGGFLLTWTVEAPYPTSFEVKGRFYDMSLSPVGPEFSVNTRTDGFQLNEGVVALAGGGYVVAWGQPEDQTYDHVRAQVLDSAGNKVGGEIIVTDGAPGDKYAMGLTALAGGGFVAAWSGFEVLDQYGNLSPGLRAQIFDGAGNKVGAAFSLNTIVPGNQTSSELAALPSGGFVAAWSDDGGRQTGGQPNGNQGVWVQLFDGLGQKIGAAVHAGTGGSTVAYTPIIVTRETGFLVTWRERDASTTGGPNELRAQRFDFSGNKVAEEFTVGGSAQAEHVQMAGLALDSGAILLGWTHRAASGFNYDDVHAQLLFPVTHGSEGGDVFSGTASRDFYLGKGGDDVAAGGAGADSLDGGAGDDVLAGGAGVDTLDGGDGTDTADFSGEPGPVSVNLHSSLFIFPAGPYATRSLGPGEALDSFGNYESVSGIENLVLTAGDDRVIGSDGANRIEAGAGADEINAMGGDDLLFLGDGDDSASGGSGADEIDGADGSDNLFGDSGSDTLNGGAGEDLLLGGVDGDSLDGGAGDDIIRGEDGDDTLRGGDGSDLLRGGKGVDSFDGGADDGASTFGDQVSFFEQRATQAVVADLRTGLITNDGFGNTETMVNVESLGGDTAFVDTFYGNDGANALFASKGDNLYGFGGDDRIALSAAAAVVDGGAGEDVLNLQASGAWYRPDSNGDGLAELAPAMSTGWFVDLGSNLIQDGYGNSGTVQDIESIVGSALEDVLFGGTGNDTLNGADGVDLLHGFGGDDRLFGGNGNDLLRGYAGVDYYDGGADDLLSDDGIYGDRVSFFDPRATQGVVADLRTGIVSNDGYGNVETMVNIEWLTGSTAFADTFYGNDSDNGLQGGRGDNLHGFGGNDIIDLTGAAAVVDGGSGHDQLRLTTAPYYLPDDNGDGVAQVGPAMTAGYVVNLAAGTLSDGFGMTGTVAGIENVVGGQFGDDIRGSSGDDVIDGGSGNDFLRLQDGGLDHVFGGEGNDVFLFGGAMTTADWVDGGAGIDQIAIQGDYSGANALTLGPIVVAFESLAILPGDDIRFGDPGTNFYDYDITTQDVNVAAGVQVIVDANRLRVGEDFTFNGSAETDGGFFIWGGGGVDTLTGGSMTDIFYFGENLQFGASDTVNGGAGIDQLGLRGNYTIVFGAGQIAGIENIGLVSAQDTRFGALGSTFNYNLTMNDANVASGVLMTVDGAALRNGETLTFNGSAETNGSFRIFGGQGNDTITTGAGNDIIQGGRGADAMTSGSGADSFRYLTTLDSTAGSIDQILAFENTVDKIDLSRIDANTLVDGNQAFNFAGSSPFFKTGTGGGGAMFAGALRAYESGDIWIVEGDTDGDAVADFVLHVSIIPSPTDILQAFDFIL